MAQFIGYSFNGCATVALSLAIDRCALQSQTMPRAENHQWDIQCRVTNHCSSTLLASMLSAPELATMSKAAIADNFAMNQPSLTGSRNDS